MTETDMPEEVICFYMPGRCESMQVAVELYEKDWRQEPYRLKSTVDAELAERDKTIERYKTALEEIEYSPEMSGDIIAREALSGPQIAKAQEGK